MIERKLIVDLEKWKSKTNRKPLILRGARQVGKTTLVRQFGKGFNTFLELNLEVDADRELFKQYDDIERLVQAIYLHKKKAQQKSDTLLFIDEIQNSSEAIATLRYFHENTKGIHVIAAGSLLEPMLKNKQISFPVGRVEYMPLRPCSFDEFLSAIGEEFDLEAIKSLNTNAIHHRLMQHFQLYMIVGGMPEVIMQYIKTKDILSTETVLESLLQSYLEDAKKYAKNGTQANLIHHILQNGWEYAAETISFEKFAQSQYRSREVKEAFQTLQNAFLLELVYPSHSVKLPIRHDFKKRPKLIWIDTGIVNYASGIQADVFSTKTIEDTWRGRIAEQIVAQELLILNLKVNVKRSFWRREKSDSEAEVDFLFPFDGKIIPIEVKSGASAHLKSLHYFMDQAPHDIAVRIWSGKYSIDEVKSNSGNIFKLINLPFYYVFMLPEILRNTP